MKGVTRHQVEVLQRVNAAGDDLLDMDQLLPQLSWEPSKEAAQFTIRALIRKGMLEKMPLKLRRGRLRVSYKVTGKGKVVLDPRGDIVDVGATVPPELLPG
jgi:predicted transcriptional regulator